MDMWLVSSKTWKEEEKAFMILDTDGLEIRLGRRRPNRHVQCESMQKWFCSSFERFEMHFVVWTICAKAHSPIEFLCDGDFARDSSLNLQPTMSSIENRSLTHSCAVAMGDTTPTNSSMTDESAVHRRTPFCLRSTIEELSRNTVKQHCHTVMSPTKWPWRNLA